MRDYLNGDIDSRCGSVSREDPMLFGIPRQVVPLLIFCDSSVRDAQMTRSFTKKKQHTHPKSESTWNQQACSTYSSKMSEFNWIMWKMLLMS